MYFSIPEIEVAGFEPALTLAALPTKLHLNLFDSIMGGEMIKSV